MSEINIGDGVLIERADNGWWVISNNGSEPVTMVFENRRDPDMADETGLDPEALRRALQMVLFLLGGGEPVNGRRVFIGITHTPVMAEEVSIQ